MKDSPLHSLSLNFNSKPRFDVQGALQGTHKINLVLAKNHIIQESPSTQIDITEVVFNKLTFANDITEQAATYSLLNGLKLQKAAELQGLKEKLNQIVASKNNDEIVNDVIGGK